MLKPFAGAALMLAAFAGPALAQDARGAALVNLQLESVSSEHGYMEIAKRSGRMSQGSSQTTILAAFDGSIVFIGACDENCTDLDMIIRDPSGREVGRDFEPDDVPVVIVDGATGAYAVEVSMPGCTGQCHWGVGLFRSPWG